jgi:hypothetical protein
VASDNALDMRNLVDNLIYEYYKKNRNRIVEIFLHSEDSEWGWNFTHFLLEKELVVRYGFGEDRGSWVGGLEIGIGPHYFGPAAFWSYQQSQRFPIEVSAEGIEKSLALLDEYLSSRRRM